MTPSLSFSHIRVSLSAVPVRSQSHSVEQPRHSISDYDIIQTIGSGSYGSVQKVTERSTGRQFAIKVISKVLLQREGKLEQGKIERLAMSRLHHPNILQLIRCFQDRESLYFVTEFAAHGDLDQRLKESVALSPEIAATILGQMLAALAYMHSKDIVHRDLKPGNILLDAKNRVRLSDFGCAKIDNSEASGHEFVGSPAYVSPEVLAKQEATAASDLWAFGCVVYATLVGQSPFQTGSSYQTFEKIRTGAFEIPPFVSDDAADLIRRLLVAEPAERLGAGTAQQGYQAIRQHPFFAGIADWAALPTAEIQLVTGDAAFRWHQEGLRHAKEREMAEFAAQEAEIRTAQITFIGPAGEVDASLVLTDGGRVVVKQGDKLLGAMQLGDDVKVREGEGMLYLDNGKDRLRVKMGEPPAREWKQLLHQVLEDRD